MSDVEIRPVTSCIGAEIRGIDLREPLDEPTVAALTGALHRHLVLFFRDQPLAPPQLLRFARQFGPLHLHPFAPSHPEYRELVVLDQTSPRGQGGDAWHSDATFMPEPPLGTILQAIQLPETGGDTCFASMYAAYDALSPPLQQLLESLRGVHDLSAQLAKAIHYGHSRQDLRAMQEKWPPCEHPAVRRHPATGRKALFVNGNFTTRLAGLTSEESERLLRFLFQHVGSPEFQCRFRWERNSIAFWDNRSVQHYAVPDYRERRVMHRVTIDASPPKVGAQPISGPPDR